MYFVGSLESYISNIKFTSTFFEQLPSKISNGRSLKTDSSMLGCTSRRCKLWLAGFLFFVKAGVVRRGGTIFKGDLKWKKRLKTYYIDCHILRSWILDILALKCEEYSSYISMIYVFMINQCALSQTEMLRAFIQATH